MRVRTISLLILAFLALLFFSSTSVRAADTTPPAWSDAGTNNYLGGQSTLFSVKWTDNLGLSGFIFGTNNTGGWTNDTWAPMSGTTNWSNVTKILNSTANLVQWTIWANDTSNNWNNTGVLSLAVLHTPTAVFTYSPSTPYSSETVTLNASASYDPDGIIAIYFWTFGDGTNATGMVATHAYADNGVYTVTLRVTDNDGLTDTYVQSIVVLNRAPTASFTEDATTVYTGIIIHFNASGSFDLDGVIVSYYWTFGDGTNGTAMLVEHAYADSGTFTVTLTVTDNDGATTSASDVKTVLNRSPVASFTESATTVLTGEAIFFNASTSYDSDGTIASYFWNFGDGTNTTGVAVSHAYVDNGTYVVTLTVTDNDGAAASKTATETVLNCPPIASFTESATQVYTGEIIFFNGSASYDPDGSIVSYFWDFGDGTNTTGVTVDHAYADNGVFTVTLAVTDNDGETGTSTAVKTVLNRFPVAIFTENATTVPTGVAIHFDASASYDVDGSIVGYIWTFGDGTNATGMIVDHAYSDNGIYVVTQTVTDNDGGTATSGATKTVLNRPPVASFTESATTVYTSEVIYFNASASSDPDGSIVSYFWDFGDGTNATGITADHSYAGNGTFTVILTLTDDDGAISSQSAVKTVLNRQPVAIFTESAEAVVVGQAIYFNASESYDPDGSIVNFFWAFGDGTNATGITTQHAYLDNGFYTVTLTITDNDDAPASTSAVKTVAITPPVAVFTESATTVFTGESIAFNASASSDTDGYIVSYFWTFGDGSNASGIVVSHAYVDEGVYTVTLIVTDDDGATATASATKTVLNRPPVAVFTESVETMLTGEPIYFNASASYDLDGSIVSFFWTFGDGANLTGMTVEHAYTDDGIYVVTLRITDDDGETATTNATKTILNRSPVASFTESAEVVVVGEIIYFNASNSYDLDGSIVSYFWTFGDGTNATGAMVDHAYADNGVYVVTLTVTDDDGATASASATKTVSITPPVAVFTPSTQTAYTNEIVSFNASGSYDPDGLIVNYFWSFGDGTNATGVTAQHAYADNGVYTVTLAVTDDDGATDTATTVVTILNRAPVASFTESAETVFTGESIYFNASNSYDLDGLIASYFWTFGDGTNATGATASHQYTDNGNYTVTLTVTDNDGATTSAVASKTVLNRVPVALFTESTEVAYTGETIRFNASDSYDLDGSIVSYFWTFGDGTNATGVNVEHAYAENGSYTVTLTITDNDGATSTATAIKTILNRPPIANFTESATTVLTDEVIFFNASSSYDIDGTIVSYLWSFGDGTNATGMVVNHAYGDNGSYTVTLTVTDNDGASGTTTAIETVLNRLPTASFTESASTVLTNEVIYFNASGSYDIDGIIASYLWTFGDGMNASGVTTSHFYAENSIYTVELTVIDNDGSTATATATKTVLNRVPIAAFTESASNVLTGEVIHFDASGSYDPDGSIATYFWNFGDGTNGTGITIDHAYSNDGVYTVTLTIMDNDGATASANAVKTVANRPPLASFTESSTTALTGETIYFNASSSYDPDGSIIEFFWTFGDGTNATGKTVEHAYTDDGIYVVTLRITDDDGETATTNATKTILNRSPVASFTESAEIVVVGQIIHFNASNSYDLDGSIVSYFWTFGDGTNATGAMVEHAYADNGVYIVTLAVTDDDGATASASATKTVSITPPVAVFTMSAQTAYTNEIVSFNASGSYDPDGSIIGYFWSFGDGINATGATSQHAYVDNGVYTVTLIVTDDDGATDDETAMIAVLNRAPVASFTESAETVFTGESICFNASSSYDLDGIIISFFWTFGDGTNATGLRASHQYIDNGNYAVTLTLTDNDGASTSAVAPKTVLNRVPVALFSESTEVAYTGESIRFNASDSYDLDGSIVSFFWTFGDGTNATGVNVEHAYVEDGSYTVALTITDNDGATSAATAIKTILNRPPIANFTESATIVQTGEVIFFNASSSFDIDGAIVSYLWDFGDGTNATGIITQHAYVDNGTYVVTLAVADNDGASSVAAATKYVQNQPPISLFSYSPSFPILGQTASFNASASHDPDGTIASYIWSFGDGNMTTTTVPAIIHTYYSFGTFTVSLTTTDNDGYTDTTTQAIGVREYPHAAFTLSPSFPITGETVTFDASSSTPNGGSIVTYSWNFGDGTPLVNTTSAVATHVYTSVGNYTANLTVIDSEGLTDVATDTVGIRGYPSASFAFAPSYPIEQEVVTFDASASTANGGIITNYQWNFGDGNITNSATPIVIHTYSAIGNYTATLTITDNEGLSSSQSKMVSVRGYPIAIFNFAPTASYVGDTVTFDASLSSPNGGAITNYQWNFGDGSPISNTANPIIMHVYAVSGNFNVSLTVSDSEGLGDTDLHLVAVSRAPVASFTYSPQYPRVGETVNLNASASYDPNGYIVSYTWSFGDGNVTTVTAPTITHAYTTTGTYTVSLAVTDNGGYTDTTTRIVALGTPKAAFTFMPDHPIVQQSITFNASSSYDPNGYITSYVWNFGDGNVTTVAQPIVTHVYTTVGNYTVALTVADNSGLTDTTTRVVAISKAPIASFTYSPQTPYAGDSMTFNASSSTPSGGIITNYVWTLGDGSPIENKTTPITTHKYAAAGNYTVSLTIKDSFGLTNTITKTVSVLQSPAAIFTHSPSFPQAFDTITFDASSSYDANGYIVSYVWNFGDGNITAVTYPIITHVYNAAGSYSVVLIVADNEGYAHSAGRIVYVSLRPPVAQFTSAPTYPIADQTVTFDASGSYDLDGSIVSYKWDFGDGNVTIVTSPIVAHRYLEEGNFTPTLTTTDNNNLTDTETSTIRVRDYPNAAFTYTPSIPDVGSAVTFNSSTSTPNGGAILYYLWNFGDGSPLLNSTSVVVTHIFSLSGNYTISLTVADSEGLSDIRSQTAYIAELPTASFVYSPGAPYMGDIVTFDASSSFDLDGYILGYVWDFGDGSPKANSTNPIITHVYGVGGNVNVTLTVTDNLGLKDTTYSTINIGKSPSASFTYDPSSPIAAETVNFDATASSGVRRPIANYTWNFGDGNVTTVTAPVITHAYPVEGSYTVTLTIIDTGGYSSTAVQVLGVRNYPVAAFTYSPGYPIRAQEVSFDATASQPRGGTIVSYLWNFGDGTAPISTSSPVLKHIYLAIGQYNVTLTVTDSENLDAVIVKTLKVRDYPTADFIWSPLTPTATQSVIFNASSSQSNSGTITAFMWEFGDGTVSTMPGSIKTITHVYSTANNYLVRLTVFNSEGLSSIVSKTVAVSDAPPTASFTYSPATPLIQQPVTFNASDSQDPDGFITSYRWSFGDGNLTTTATATIYHIYVNPGNFTVTLTVTDNANLTAAASSIIRIMTYPTASFTWSPPHPNSAQPIIFNASASSPNSGYMVSYSWNFGDGNTTTVTTSTIVHMYSKARNTTVTLTVTNSEGLSNSLSQPISVSGTPPTAAFTWQPLNPLVGETVTFDASSSIANGGTIILYGWDFHDGTPPTPLMFGYRTYRHPFANYGQFSVTLRVVDDEGFTVTETKTVTVIAPPTAQFAWSPLFPQAYQSVTFDASTSTPNGGTIASYRWDFGDGNATTMSIPIIVHVYPAGGNYTVTLTVTDSEGLAGAKSQTISVAGATGPQADFAYSPLSPYVFEMVTFNASASVPGTGSIVDYQWSFGDGNVTSVAEPVIIHAYQASGNFTATLIVRNTAGLTSTKSRPITALPTSGPTANFTWSPFVPQPNQTICFDASISLLGWNGSVHPPIISWFWDFGDGNITLVSQAIVYHTFEASGNYIVTLIVTDVNGESDGATNAVKVTILLGDLNGDGKVDIRDIAIVAKAYGSSPGYPNWNPIADLNGDGKVDIRDIAIVAKQYGKTTLYMVLLDVYAENSLSPLQAPVIAWMSFCFLALAFITESGESRRTRVVISIFERACFVKFLAF